MSTLVLVVSALTLSACGSGGGNGSPPPTSASPMPSPAPSAIIPTTYVSETRTNADGSHDNIVQAFPSNASAYIIGPIVGQVVVAKAPGAASSLFVEVRVGTTDMVESFSPGSTTPKSSFAIQNHLGPVTFAVDASGAVYVPGGSTNVVDVYDSSNGSHIRSFAPGVNDPTSIALQADGTIFVAGRNPSAVAVIPPTSATPTRTITNIDGSIRGIAVDSVGTLYVADGAPQHGDLQVFAPGAMSPTSSLAVNGASDVAVDSARNFYVATADNTFQTYAPGAVTPTTITPTVGVPDSLAI